MNSRGNSTKYFLRSFVFALAICVAVILFLVGFMKAFVQDYAVRKEIRSLEQEKAQLSQNKLNLLDRLQDIKSDSFVEKEARLKFELQKPGESVILFNTRDTSAEGENATNTARVAGETNSNASLWWRYFFHIK